MIPNKVTSSGLIVIDLEEYIPSEVLSFDLRQFLFKDSILKEKNFRESLKQFDWGPYVNQMIALYCSTDAIIPHWAYMLVLVYLQPIGARCFMGDPIQAKQHFFIQRIQSIDINIFKDKRVILKGCGQASISSLYYVIISEMLIPVVKALMYGEPCSNVPIYRQTELLQGKS